MQVGPPRRASIPVLALSAQTSHWTYVAAALPGHRSSSGARGTGAIGSSRQVGPFGQSTMQTGSRTSKRYREAVYMCMVICSGTGVVAMGVVFAIDDPRRRPTARPKRADALDWSIRSSWRDAYEGAASSEGGCTHTWSAAPVWWSCWSVGIGLHASETRQTACSCINQTISSFRF